MFTPYKNAWLKKLDAFYLKAYPVAHHAGALAPLPPALSAAAADAGRHRLRAHQPAALKLPSGSAGGAGAAGRLPGERIDRYHETRDFPAVKGPSYLSAHLRFGTVSIRHLAREAWQRTMQGRRARRRRSGCPS